MDINDPHYQEKYILGNLFFLANRLQVIMDQKLSEFDITTKQWFMIAAISRLGNLPSTIDEVAASMGCSHQNVKQLALKLQQKGFIQIHKDQKDKRISRIILLEKSKQMSIELNKRATKLFNELFCELSQVQINNLYDELVKVSSGLEKIQ